MDVQEIKGMGRPLERFLSEFDDCFGRSEPREHLRTYVQGQLSNLPRKSIEPIALEAGVAPRTLQEFMGLHRWEHEAIRRRVQNSTRQNYTHREP